MSKLKKYISVLLVMVLVLSVLPVGSALADGAATTSRVLKINPNSKGAGWNISGVQTPLLDVKAGTEYTLSFWVMGAGDYKVIFKNVGYGSDYTVKAAAPSAWTEVSVTYVAAEDSAEGNKASVEVYSLVTTEAVYIDDISIMDENGTEYVTNGGFENGFNDWTGFSWNPSEFGLAEMEAHPETSAPPEEPVAVNHLLEISPYESGSSFAYQGEYSMAEGDYIDGMKYTISYKIIGEGTVRVTFAEWGNGPAGCIAEATATSDGQLITSSFVANESVRNKAAMTIYRNAGDAGTVYIDDVSVVDETGKEYVINGDFEDDTTGWSGMGGVFKVVKGDEIVVKEPTQPSDPETEPSEPEETKPSTPVEPNEPAATSNVLKITDQVFEWGEVSLQQMDHPFTTVPGMKYTLTFWVKGQGYVKVAAGNFLDGPEGSVVNMQAPSEWTKVTTSYVAEEGSPKDNTAFITIYSNKGSGVELYYDDVSIVDENGTEYVANGDFENGFNGWAGHWNSEYSIVEMDAHPAEESAPENLLELSEYRGGETYTAPEAPEGKIFAGWYTDEDLTNPLDEDVTDGKAYAKFVDADVLGVKWQITAGTTAGSEKTSLRLLTTVDDLKYSEVGFDVDAGDGKARNPSAKTVYKKVTGYGDGVTQYYAPTIFSESSQYFMAYNFNNIPSSVFDTQILVTPRWTTMDGTVVTGDTVTVVISDAFGG